MLRGSSFCRRRRQGSPPEPVCVARRSCDVSDEISFERLQLYLRAVDSHGYCIYDHDTRRTDALHAQSIELMRGDSEIGFFSQLYAQMVSATQRLDRIGELSLGKSDNSIGLQAADFFATMAYSYFRDGRPANCGWWDTLCAFLFREGNELLGRGLKIFP